jgi:hypothetical protein
VYIDESSVSSDNDSQTCQIPKHMRSFLDFMKYPNTSFRDRALLHRFKKMTLNFDHSVNYYSSESTQNPLSSQSNKYNRHRRSSHVDQALERLHSESSKQTLEQLKNTFTNFRHMEGCPVKDSTQFSNLHLSRREGDLASSASKTLYGVASWRKKSVQI